NEVYLLSKQGGVGNIAAANLSLGSGSYTSNCDYYSIKPAIDQLRNVGIATVVASGNGSSSNSISYPACVSTAVSVGATDDSDDVESFSNSDRYLSLLAPGYDVSSSVA